MVLVVLGLFLPVAVAYHSPPEDYQWIGVMVCDGDACHVDILMHYWWRSGPHTTFDSSNAFATYFIDDEDGLFYAYECAAWVYEGTWRRNATSGREDVSYWEPEICEGPLGGMCGGRVSKRAPRSDLENAVASYNEWGWEYWNAGGGGQLERRCGPLEHQHPPFVPDPEVPEDCIEVYERGESLDHRWCEETLQGVLGLLREWLQILLRRSASPDPGGPGPPGGGGGAGPPGGGGGADPDDPSLVSPGDFVPHNEVGFWGEIPLIYVDLQARLDAVRSDIDEATVDRFPFVVMRYVPELAEDGSPASSCNDIVITLVGTPTALGWCGSGVQGFLAGWGRSIMGVLVTVVYGFGMAHTVVRS